MLIEYSVSNYKSFKDRAVLSLMASSIKDLEDEAIIPLERVTLLKGAVVYGSNGSGKSNLLNSLAFMKWLVVYSSRESQAEDPLDIEPFLLNDESIDQPSTFEIVFQIDKTRYRYGFEATEKEIVSEWLFESVKRKENPLFVREGDNIQLVEKFVEGERLEDKTRSNALFLSVVAQFNGEISTSIINWFRNMNLVHGIHDDKYFGLTAEMLENKETQNLVLDFVRYADLGIINMQLKEIERDLKNIEKLLNKKNKKVYDSIMDEIKSQKLADVITYHNTYDSLGNIIGQKEFSLAHQESQGTNKFFNIIGAVIKSLLNGEVLVIDELNVRMHPLLTRKIVQTFNSKAGNPNNSQLIFTTHDTNLLDRSVFRRDQVYFTEKDSFSRSYLYSLVEYKPRNDEAYEKNYIGGKYGAIPFVGDFDSLISSKSDV